MRYWSEDEVRDYLPRLRIMLAVIKEAAERPNRVKTNGHASVAHTSAGHSELSAADAAQELDEFDVVVRDPISGIVDFWARDADGTEYFLCWKDGEEDLGWWHLPDEGFIGRKPLPRAGS